MCEVASGNESAAAADVAVGSRLSEHVSVWTLPSGTTAIQINEWHASTPAALPLAHSAADSFGRRTGKSNRRPDDCVVLEPSEMIVIDYPDVSVAGRAARAANGGVDNSARKTIQSMNLENVAPPHPSHGRLNMHRPSCPPKLPLHAFGDPPPQLANGCCSRAGPSSAVMRNGAPGGGGGERPRSNASSTKSTDSFSIRVSYADVADELSGLPEGNVDSDEDDDESCPSGDSFMELRDNVRECLEKEPEERTEDDLLTLLDFMQHMPAFANLPVSVKKELCWKMVFAVVERAGQVVMRDGEQLDSWSVIVNGEVEVLMADGTRVDYHLGDSFGVDARPELQQHRGQMRTLVDDCQFVLVAQQDFCAIMARATDALQRHTDAAGEVVSETERRTLNGREGYVLVKGKPDRLLAHLIEERDTAVDPYYVEDFLLVHRTFIDNSVTVFERLVHWFNEMQHREKVARLVLLWVNNHFNDFETNPDMLRLLEQFEQALERESMQNHQALLNIACSVKSRSRTVTYARSDYSEVLHFSVLGGIDKGFGIFISKVEPGSQAERVGMKRGDEVLEVNGQNFQHIPHQRALKLLRDSTHLSITLKSNLLGFKEMLAAPDRADGGAVAKAPPLTLQQKAARNGATRPATTSNNNNNWPTTTLPPPAPSMTPNTRSCAYLPRAQPNNPQGIGSPSHTLKAVSADSRQASSSSLMGRIMNKIRHGPNFGMLADSDSDQSDAAVSFYPSADLRKSQMAHSRSNPDISAHGISGGISQYYQPVKSVSPEHVLKIYRGDQSFKYLTVYKETSAHNVVQLALQEFGMAESSSRDWSLCETQVTSEGVIKQRRLPEQLQNLAERISLNSRYYLKNNQLTEPLVPDELAPELQKEALTQLLQLNAHILAAQLTLQDFAVFAAIEPTEYVDNLFKLDSRYGWPKLAQFERTLNTETWWVASEICAEKTLMKRAKLVKKFIKVARHCRELRNFNSMFAVMSGLEKPAVRRLHHTWEKVAAKYTRMFDELQLLLDPSRNMSKYRQHLSVVSQEPPVVPLFPVIKKDLTFIHEGNRSKSDALVNFEKLRMIAKEIRAVCKLSSAPFELHAMSEQTGGSNRLNDALLHMNSFEGGANVATMRKQFQSKTTQPRKKLYEQALMVRKVKNYLTNLKVIEDESTLDRLSMECEPATSSSSLGSVNVQRRRMPSPSPSSASSLSTASDQRRFNAPKFGVESPHAVQKMMALVDHSRVARSAAPAAAAAAVAAVLPSPSGSPRRLGVRPRRAPSFEGAHGRSVSESGNGAASSCSLLPVDLTAECSSVTTLLAPGLRLSSTGSVASTDSAVSQQSGASQATMSHAISSDSTDSGHASMDPRVHPATSVGASAAAASPTSQRRSAPPPSARMAAVAQSMHHRANPAFFQPPPRRADKPTKPTVRIPPVAANYTNVVVASANSRRPEASRKASDNDSTSSGEQVSRV